MDGVTAEVVEAFRAARIRPIVLKGPSLALWLYDDGSARYYMDSDVLVERGQVRRAEVVLESLGFRRRPAVTNSDRKEPHAEPWFRDGDRAEVDLHSTLFGLGVAPEHAWPRIAGHTELLHLGGTPVEVLGMPARTLLVALHAAQHGADKAKPLEDLDRALRRVSDQEWAAVAELAAELHATQNLARGLRLAPEGAALADRLGLVNAELAELAAQPHSHAALVMGLERLAQSRGLRAKAQLVFRELFPPADFLRWWSPLARRRWGLPVAHVWRLVWLARQLPASVAAWRRNRPS